MEDSTFVWAHLFNMRDISRFLQNNEQQLMIFKETVNTSWDLEKFLKKSKNV